MLNLKKKHIFFVGATMILGLVGFGTISGQEGSTVNKKAQLSNDVLSIGADTISTHKQEVANIVKTNNEISKSISVEKIKISNVKAEAEKKAAIAKAEAEADAKAAAAKNNIVKSSAAVKASTPATPSSAGISVNTNVKTTSNYTAEQINAFVKGTGLDGLGASFKKAESTYTINAGFLMGITINESNWGNSALAKSKNNLFGTRKNGTYISYGSKEESIMKVAEMLTRKGFVYEKRNTPAKINEVYAQDSSWAQKAVKHWSKL